MVEYTREFLGRAAKQALKSPEPFNWCEPVLVRHADLVVQHAEDAKDVVQSAVTKALWGLRRSLAEAGFRFQEGSVRVIPFSPAYVDGKDVFVSEVIWIQTCGS